jgi:AraC-like DNA-binding protein
MEMAGEAIMGRAFTNKLNRRIIHPHPASMSRLLKLHKAVGQLSHDAPDILEQPEVRRALEGQLMHVMVRCLAESVGVETTTGGRRHDAIVARFEEFLAGNPDRPLYLTEICAAIGVAERTLRASCEEHLGMGPVRYLTLRRMHLCCAPIRRGRQSPVLSRITASGSLAVSRSPTARCSANLLPRHCGGPHAEKRVADALHADMKIPSSAKTSG